MFQRFEDRPFHWVFHAHISLAQASERCRPAARIPPSVAEELLASFKSTRCIYHSDISQENFLLDANKKVWIIDFEHIGVFPEEFQNLGLFYARDDFPFKVAEKLGYEMSRTAIALVPISRLLWMWGGNASLSMCFMNCLGWSSYFPSRNQMVGVTRTFHDL